MRIAVYGGSFDPPHVGHLLVAHWVLATRKADAVWLLPSHAHPFEKRSQPFDVRVGWCEAIAATAPGVDVCAIEAELPAPTYTIDVLDTLAARHPEHTFRFLLGADLLATVDRWKEWPRLAEQFEPVVVGRQGYDEPDVATIAFPPVSSTEVRERVRRGAPIEHLVPAVLVDEVRRTFRAPRMFRTGVLDALPGVVHGFTGRDGGVDWERTLPALDARYTAASVAWMTQVHGNEVRRVVRPSGPERTIGEADAAFTTELDVVLAVRTADCVPVLVAGPGVVGVAHAGWRGVASEVVPALLHAIQREAGVRPDELTAAIGPAISGEAYEVGDEVVQALEQAGLDPGRFLVSGAADRPHVDLRAAVGQQLEMAGVGPIEVVQRCTATDPELFSYRADGPDTGRQAGLIARRAQ